MPRLTQSEIHSNFSSASETWSEYRAQVIAFYDNYPHGGLNDHITREFNKKIRDLGQAESLYISPYNAGLRYIGDGVFTVDPLSFNPYFYIDAASSMLGVLESPSLDLNPAVSSTLDIITATRAGTATYTDASGNIQTASPNTVRVDHPQGAELTPTKFQHVGNTDFSDWIAASSTTLTDGSGYAGQPSKIFEASGGTHRTFRTPTFASTAGTTYTGSIWIKRVSGTGTIQINHQYSAQGNLTDITSEISEEWTRVEVNFTGHASSGDIWFGIWINVQGDSIEVAMPQVEEGTTASDFVENTTGIKKLIATATYAPRVPMMLIEPAATNTIRWSEDSSAYNYGSGTTFESSDVLAPNGQASAFKITPDGSNYTNRKGSSSRAGSWSPNDVVTMSVWLKTDGYDYFLKVGGFFGSEGAVFDSLDGSVQSTEGNVISASSEDYGNGWFRYKVTYTFQNTINNGLLYSGVHLLKRDASNNPVTSFDGTGETTGVLVYGTQFELGSVATSYIPTDDDASGVTRAADNLVIDGSDFTNFYNASEGTVYVEYEPRVLGTTTTALEFSDGTADNRIFSLATFSYHCYIIDGGVSQALLDGGTNTAGVLNRLAFSYEANNIQASLDGGAVVSDTSASIPTVDRLTLGNQTVSNTRLLNGHIKRLIYWPHHSDNI